MVCSNVYNARTEKDVKVSAHFKVSEFACKDGSSICLVHRYLWEKLEALRRACGNRPITINSGYRTYQHNKNIGGASNSYHLYGLAADIVVSGMSALKVAQLADKIFGDSGGVGLYNGYVHIDGRVSKYRFDKRSGVEKAVDHF